MPFAPLQIQKNDVSTFVALTINTVATHRNLHTIICGFVYKQCQNF